MLQSRAPAGVDHGHNHGRVDVKDDELVVLGIGRKNVLPVRLGITPATVVCDGARGAARRDVRWARLAAPAERVLADACQHLAGGVHNVHSVVAKHLRAARKLWFCEGQAFFQWLLESVRAQGVGIRGVWLACGGGRPPVKRTQKASELPKSLLMAARPRLKPRARARRAYDIKPPAHGSLFSNLRTRKEMGCALVAYGSHLEIG